MVVGTRCSSGLDEVLSVNAKVLKLLPILVRAETLPTSSLESLRSCLLVQTRRSML